jgi:hypothetical protein
MVTKTKYIPLNMSVFPAEELSTAVGCTAVGGAQTATQIDFVATGYPSDADSIERFCLALWANDVPSVVVLGGPEDSVNPPNVEQWWPTINKQSPEGAFKLHTTDEDNKVLYSTYTVRLSSGSKAKEVKVYHMANWESGKAPDENNFREFHSHFQRDHKKPCRVMVHCSTGAGRTGTFIAVDSITRYLSNRPPDTAALGAMKGVMTYMRSKRSRMIQSLAQFQFIYEYCFVGTLIGKLTRQKKFKVTDKKKVKEPDPSQVFQELEKVEPKKISLSDVDQTISAQNGHTYSRPTVVSCSGVEETSICSQTESSDLLPLVRYMVGERPNLPIFKQFLEEYYGDVEKLLSDLEFRENLEFGEALVAYLINKQLNLDSFDAVKGTALTLFEKLLVQLYSGERGGERFEKFLRDNMSGTERYWVRMAIQDTWWRTHPPAKKSMLQSISELFASPNKTAKSVERSDQTQPSQPSVQTGPVDSFAVNFGIVTTPFQFDRQKGPTGDADAVKEVLHYLIGKQKRNKEQFKDYLATQYGTRISTELVSARFDSVTHGVDTVAQFIASRIFNSLFEKTQLTYAFIINEIRSLRDGYKLPLRSEELLLPVLRHVRNQMAVSDPFKNLPAKKESTLRNVVYVVILSAAYTGKNREWVDNTFQSLVRYNVTVFDRTDALKKIISILQKEFNDGPMVDWLEDNSETTFQVVRRR